MRFFWCDTERKRLIFDEAENWKYYHCRSMEKIFIGLCMSIRLVSMISYKLCYCLKWDDLGGDHSLLLMAALAPQEVLWIVISLQSFFLFEESNFLCWPHITIPSSYFSWQYLGKKEKGKKSLITLMQLDTMVKGSVCPMQWSMEGVYPLIFSRGHSTLHQALSVGR